MSLRLAVACIGLCAHTTVSKQAVAKRFRPAVDCLREALALVMAQFAQQTARLRPVAFAAFRRVLVQDSASVALAGVMKLLSRKKYCAGDDFA